jgi:hypothetical protein
VALRSGGEARNRKRELRRLLSRGADGIVCHPRLVQTGLNLSDCPTIIFYQFDYSTFTLRQASRRSYRPWQTQPVDKKNGSHSWPANFARRSWPRGSSWRKACPPSGTREILPVNPRAACCMGMPYQGWRKRFRHCENSARTPVGTATWVTPHPPLQCPCWRLSNVRLRLDTRTASLPRWSPGAAECARCSGVAAAGGITRQEKGRRYAAQTSDADSHPSREAGAAQSIRLSRTRSLRAAVTHAYNKL